MDYELFQQGPAVYIPIILLSLTITVVAYGALPLIIAKARRSPVAKKKYRKLCFGVNVAVMILFMIINDEPSNGGPYFLWTGIFSSWGIKILQSRGLLTDNASSDNIPAHATEQEIMRTDANYYVVPAQSSAPTISPKHMNHIRFCKNCGEKLTCDDRFCGNCGTEVIEEYRVRFCRNCGEKLTDDSLFCGECGTKVIKE